MAETSQHTQKITESNLNVGIMEYDFRIGSPRDLIFNFGPTKLFQIVIKYLLKQFWRLSKSEIQETKKLAFLFKIDKSFKKNKFNFVLLYLFIPFICMYCICNISVHLMQLLNGVCIPQCGNLRLFLPLIFLREINFK